MALRKSQHQARAASAGNITVAGNTAAQTNLCQSERATTVVLISVGAVSGAGASLTPQFDVSLDGTTWYKASAFTAITAAGQYRLVVNDVLEPNVRVSWPLPAGTTPSFQTVSIDLLFV